MTDVSSWIHSFFIKPIGSDPSPRSSRDLPLTMVLLIELLNSSGEAAIDRVSFERHDPSK